MNIPKIDKPALVFGTTEGLPDYDTVPDEFKDGNTKWNRLFRDWFYSGVSELKFVPQEGIPPQEAYHHICALMRSFGSKHEHKEAGVAYLLSQYFKDCSYKCQEKVVEFDGN